MRGVRWAALVVAVVLAAGVAPAAGAEPNAVAKVSVLRGAAARHRPDGSVTALGRGDRLYEDDRIETASKSLVSILFDDKTRFNLGPRASFRIDRVRSGEDSVFSAEVLRGAFRFVTGLIAKNKPRSMRVRTGIVATIGIRGTTVGGEVQGESTTVVLLASEDGDAGSAIEVGNEHGSVVIEQAGYGTRVPDRFSPPSPPERMSLRAIDSLVRNINSIQRLSVPRPRVR